MIDLLLPSGQTLPTENTKFKTESSKFECKSYNFLPPASMYPFCPHPPVCPHPLAHTPLWLPRL